MATFTVTRGYNDPTGFTSGETITPAKLNSAQTPSVAISAIQTADISDSQITTGKLADRAVTAIKMSGVAAIESKTADYTLALADRGKVIEVNSASNLVVTVPTNASAAFDAGATIMVTRRGSGEVTITGSNSVTLRSSLTACSVTGVASTDVLTASGNNFAANQNVRFVSVTGGTGVDANTNYFVRDISGSTFKLSATSGGSAVDFTTDISAGSIVAMPRVSRQYSAAACIKIGTDEWMVLGNLK